MDSIRVKNLRSLGDTDELPIKKMNILVGNNSSGKSTFLRIFPLLKQSFNKKINGPVLWCGDEDDYVDFGSFDEAVNYNSDTKCIELSFEIKVDLVTSLYRFKADYDDFIEPQKVKIEFSIKNSIETGYDYISKLQYYVEQHHITVNFNEKNEIQYISINEKEISLNKINKDDFFPFFYQQGLFDINLSPLKAKATSNLKKLFLLTSENDATFRKIDEYAEYIITKKIFGIDNIEFDEKLVQKVEEICRIKEYKCIEQWVMLYYLPHHYVQISEYLKSYFSNVYYIAPVRATAQRYYRLMNLAVKEVDCRGKNLPIFLNSLSEKSFKQFQKWTQKYLGFEVIKTLSEGHVSLKIRKSDQKKAINLSDSGFGYSQILPIVTQIWYIEEFVNKQIKLPFESSGIPHTIIIEQPELHLHPALQAKLIDIMIKVASDSDIYFIIETHSETMINRVGRAIEKKAINCQDVGIIIFEKEFDEDNTVVKQGKFDEEGYLDDWPIGFFEPEED